MIRRLMAKLGVTDSEELKAFIWQFIKFGIVGISNTAVSLGIYYLVLWLAPGLYILGQILGTVLSIANAFFWNNRYVFQGNSNDVKSVLKRLGKTYVSYGGTSLLATVLLWAEVSLLGMSKAIAPLVNLAVTIPLNFIINKFWTFGEDK